MYQQSQDHQQEWVIVTKNKRSHRGSIKNKKVLIKGNLSFLEQESSHLELQRFKQSKAYLKNKEIYKQVVSKALSSRPLEKVHVECLGLGSFTKSKKSFLQMLFLRQIILSQNLEKPTETTLNIYDPVFNEEEKTFINKGLQSSCEKQFKFENKALNVYFMPHCQRQLYEEVLSQCLKIKREKQTDFELIIIGNSLSDYMERCRLTKSLIPQIFEQIHLHQTPILDYCESMNDTVIMY